MNLHQIASGLISAVNPFQNATVQVSTGYTTAASGKRSPIYTDPITVSAQVQELTTQNLRQLDALNIQGSMRKIYMNGALFGAVRFSQRGGDLITLADGTVWLTTAVLERWDTGWVAVSVTLQNGS